MAKLLRQYILATLRQVYLGKLLDPPISVADLGFLKRDFCSAWRVYAKLSQKLREKKSPPFTIHFFSLPTLPSFLSHTIFLEYLDVTVLLESLDLTALLKYLIWQVSIYIKSQRGFRSKLPKPMHLNPQLHFVGPHISYGILLLLSPWARNFSPIASPAPSCKARK